MASKSLTHSNIANNDVQVFFFVWHKGLKEGFWRVNCARNSPYYVDLQGKLC